MIICCCNKTNFSSSINEVIRPVLYIYIYIYIYFFFYDKTSQVQKSTINILYFFRIRFHKYKKALKSTKKHNQYMTVCSCHVTYAFESESTL